MLQGKKSITIVFVIALMLSLVFAVNAQEFDGALVLGQPALGDVEAGGTLTFEYTLADARAVTLQVVSETAQAAISVKQNGALVASQLNANGELLVTLTALLNNGTYSVEVTALNNTSGLIIVLVQSETPIEIAQLTAGVGVSREVNTSTPISFFAFDALAEPAYVLFENVLDKGAAFRLINAETNEVVTSTNGAVTGTRVRIAAGDAAYRVEVVHSGGEQGEAFNICYAAVSNAVSCDVNATQAPAVEAQPTIEIVTNAACTVTPAFAGGANIRQTADVNSVAIGALPGGASADVLGIAPNGAFYNIQFNAINGWVALSAITENGDCANLATVQPPPGIFPTATPTNTPVPVIPTNTPIPPTATPSGPCLLSLNSDVHVYVIPVEMIDHLQDQVGAGGELIPVGRLADNSWWKTNYYNAWVPTRHFGNNITVSGDCSSLPTVAP